MKSTEEKKNKKNLNNVLNKNVNKKNICVISYYKEIYINTCKREERENMFHILRLVIISLAPLLHPLFLVVNYLGTKLH